MQIRTTNQLKSYMASRGLSPEQLSKELKISNMTIRRLLQRHGNVRIPEKYYSTFDSHTTPLGSVFSMLDGTAPGDFSDLFRKLRRDGDKVVDFEELEESTAKKLRKSSVGSRFRVLTREMLAFCSRSHRPAVRTLAAGALLYFINPLDCIPDYTAAVGFIDDYAVLSLTTEWLARSRTH